MPTIPENAPKPRRAPVKPAAPAASAQPDRQALMKAIETESTRRQALAIIEQEDRRRAPSMAAGVTRSIAQGASFGFADEIEAAARAGIDLVAARFRDPEADAAIRSLWARGDGPGFAAAARRR